MAQGTLLSQLRSQVAIDLDSLDPAVAARHTTESERFCDMTSNQAIAYWEASKPEKLPFVLQAIEEAKGEEGDTVDNVLDTLTVLMAKEVYPYLTGRILTQTSPLRACDTKKTVAHAKRLISLFESHGIPKSRVCIKIPATPEAMLACAELEKIGYAMAASQAGCLSISPYLHELRVHFEPEMSKGYKDKVEEHAMYSIIRNIIATYKQIGSKTLTKPASVVSSAEVLALAALHPDNLTLSGPILDQLASLPAESLTEAAAAPETKEPKPHHPDVSLSTPPTKEPNSSENEPSLSMTTTDFLADDANALRKALAADSEATRKIADALRIFGEMEDKTRALVKEHLK